MTGSIHSSDVSDRDETLILKNDAVNSRSEMIPPDGGWGWAILAGNCILMFLLPTSPVCYGVVYLALVEQTGISNTVASGITAVLLGMAAFLGPFSTALSNFHSHRKLALIGVTIMAVGLMFCSFSLNIAWLYFSFILIGFGNSLGTPQVFLIGQEYFAKKRVTVNALASSAYTIGYIVLPIIIIHLISTYSIRGAFLIWAGIILNGLVGAMLYQPIERHMKSRQVVVPPTVTFSDINKVYQNDRAEERYDHTISTNFHQYGKETLYDINKTVESNGQVCDDKYSNLLCQKQDIRNTCTDQKFNSFDSLQSIGEDDTYSVIDAHSGIFVEKVLSKNNGDLKERPCSFISTTSIDSYFTAKTNFKSMISVAPSEYYDAMASFTSIQYNANEVVNLNAPMLETHERKEYPRINMEVIDKAEKNTPKSHIICGISFPWFSDLFNLEVLLNPVFLIIAVSSAVYRQIYYGYSSFIPVVAYQKQLEEYIPSLLIVLAVAEIISKFCTGFIVDREWITARKLYMGSTLINCFALIVTGLSNTLIPILLMTSILGIGLGISSSVGPVMLVKYHSLELLPYSYGLMLFLSGVVTFILFPFQGWTIDKTGSANYLCFIFASLCIVPLLLWLLMPIAQKYNKASKKKKARNYKLR